MDEYPIYKVSHSKLLSEAKRVPEKLYARGSYNSIIDNSYHYLAIVGTRKISPYGKEVCREIIKGLRAYPFVIISGLALGTDTLVHELCLEYNIPTVAIVGSGLDEKFIYPRSNFGLAKRILDSGSCVLSPFEPSFKATPWGFPIRNSLMAGMSHAIIVIEAENKSGSRITARLATEFNREVFSVPGSIFSTLSEGTNKLLQEGAVPLLSSQDILDFFGYEKEKNSLNIEIQIDDPIQKEILNFLETERPRDTIHQYFSHYSATEILIALSSLEIAGYIHESQGVFRRT